MNKDFRQQILETIEQNIQKSGRHIYSIMGGESPRYLYTIGLHEKRGFELVLPGMATLPISEGCGLLNAIADELEQGGDPKSFTLESKVFGRFSLKPVHESWVKMLLLGAIDYYSTDKIKAYQVVPEQEKGTIDIPSMAFPYSKDTDPVWRWAEGGWPYQVPSSSRVLTNTDALFGFAVNVLTRWEHDEWEMFSDSGEEITLEDMHPVPLATLIAFDPTLEAALEVPIGEGLYREFDGEKAGPWQRWVPKE